MPQMLWTRYFLEAQGYSINKSIFYQDNMSAMLLEKNRENPAVKFSEKFRALVFPGCGCCKGIILLGRQLKHRFSFVIPVMPDNKRG